MLIDRINKVVLKSINFLLPDGAGEIFYINESFEDFIKSNINCINKESLDNFNISQKIPFESFIIHFDDGFFTFGTIDFNESYSIISDSIVINNGEIKIYSPDVNKFIIYDFNEMFFLDKITLCDREDRNISVVSNIEDIHLINYFILSKFLSFLSCKNIKIVDIEPPEKLQMERARMDKPPLVSYKILELNDISKSKTRVLGKTGLWSNRIHLCRGHVREYTKEHPLFGKYSGRFWVAPHVRGNKELGAVKKDYRIVRTKNAAQPCVPA